MAASVGCAEGAARMGGASAVLAGSSGGSSGAAVVTAELVAVDAISCVLRAPTVPAERCEEIARSAGTTAEGLARADHSVIDQLGEVIVRRARGERMTASQRVGVARWFDLGVAAAREAAVANSAARAASLQRVRASEGGSGDLDAIEAAAARDASEVRSRAQLDALRAFAREGLEGASEAEAIAVIVAIARVDGARGAHETTRADTVQSSVDLAVDVAGASSVRALSERAQTGSGDRGALRATGAEAPSLDDARARLQLRASEACSRASPAVRQWCERSARPMSQ
jgi:hypothetical protein